VALLPQGRPPAMANVLLRAGFDAAADAVAQLNTLVGDWAATDPQLQLVTPLAAGGVGMLQYGGGVPLLYTLADGGNGSAVLYVMVGMAADAPSLRAAIAALEPSPNHPMYAIEAQLDSTAQGPFLWLDAGRVGPGVMAGMNAAAGAQAMGGVPVGMLGSLGSMAVGLGARDGKGRMGVVIELPEAAGLGQMLPAFDNRFELSSRGRPWMFGSINIPAQRLLQTFEGFLQMDPEALADYQIDKTAFADAFGLSYEQVAGLLGPEWLFFGDDVGEYGAIRVRDEAALQTLLAHVAETDGVDYSETTIGGVVYHHLDIHGLMARVDAANTASDDNTGAKPEAPLVVALKQLKQRANTHLYWVRDGEYLVFAQVPQLLMDRAAATDPVVIGNWLVEQQGQQTDHALLALSARVDKMPRRLYYGWLHALQWVGDITDQPLDLLAQTPASQLALPDSGAYGLQLTVDQPYLSLEMSFEASPLEFLLSQTGAFATVMTAVGVGVGAGSAQHDAQAQCAAQSAAQDEVPLPQSDAGGAQ